MRILKIKRSTINSKTIDWTIWQQNYCIIKYFNFNCKQTKFIFLIFFFFFGMFLLFKMPTKYVTCWANMTFTNFVCCYFMFVIRCVLLYSIEFCFVVLFFYAPLLKVIRNKIKNVLFCLKSLTLYLLFLLLFYWKFCSPLKD